MTETNPLLLELMRPEKRPPLKTAEMILKMSFSKAIGAKKMGYGPGYIAAKTGKSYDEVLSDTIERLKSCRKVVESDPLTYKGNALDVIDKMIASAVSALNHG